MIIFKCPYRQKTLCKQPLIIQHKVYPCEYLKVTGCTVLVGYKLNRRHKNTLTHSSVQSIKFPSHPKNDNRITHFRWGEQCTCHIQIKGLISSFLSPLGNSKQTSPIREAKVSLSDQTSLVRLIFFATCPRF